MRRITTESGEKTYDFTDGTFHSLFRTASSSCASDRDAHLAGG